MKLLLLIKQKLLNNLFVRNVLTLMTGTTVAQIIPMVVAPLLTRIYTPNDYGLLALFSSLSAFFSIVATARYELAIVLPAKDEHAFNLFALSSVITVVFSLILLIIFCYTPTSFWELLLNSSLENWIYVIPLNVLLLGLYQSLSYWANRKKEYKRIALSRVYQSVLVAFSNIGMGLCEFGVSGLIVGGIIGQSIATIILGWQTWIKDRFLIAVVKYKTMMEQANLYKKFPLINTPHALLDTINTSGTIFILTYYFGTNVVGQFAIMQRILQMPVSLIGGAIAQVFYQSASQRFQEGKCIRPLVVKLLHRLVNLIIVPAFILFFFAPDLFNFVFGERWSIAGQYTQMLVPYMFFHFLVSPLSFIPFILNEQFKSFLISTCGNALYLCCIIYAGIQHDIMIGLKLISILLPIYFILCIIWFLTITKRTFFD